jgi:hypothetical protein
MTDQLFPREPRRMLQPRKDEIRWRLELLSAQVAFDSTPMWWRIWHRVWVRIVEVDRIERTPNTPPHRNPPPPQTEPGELL